MKLETPNVNTLQSYKLFTVFKAGNFRLEYTFCLSLITGIEIGNIKHTCLLSRKRSNKQGAGLWRHAEVSFQTINQ